MHNSKIKRITLAVCLALMPFSAGAAGLGKMTVMSGLGEPLNAEIEIAANKEELSSLSARIAPSETYAEQGVERASSLGAVRVELSRKPDGTPILKLSSPQPINEPFLDMLVQVDWPTGRLLREYTALLDPPGYGDRAASGSEAVVEGTQLPAAAAPSKKNTTKNASRLASKAVQTEPTGSADTYVTKRGDTLRNVARQMQVDDVTLEQMLVGLYRSNRDAFMGDNMNQLKVGQIMRAPREDELRAINPQDALQEVRVHTANWNAYRNDVAQAVAQSRAAPAETQPQTSGGKITAQAEDRAAPPATGPRDVVKLSKSDAGAEKGGAGSGAPAISDDKMRALEEESTSQEKAIAEVNERIAFFEKQIQDMQKLLLVQNQILSDLQKGKPVDQAPGADAAPAPAQPQDQLPPAEQAAPAKKATPASKPPVETPAEPTLLDRLIQDPLMMGAAGGALLLLVGGWWLLRRQRRKNLDSFEKGILTSSGLKSDTVFGTTAGAAVDTGETSFMSDFSHRNGAGMIDTNDVDPISEAEVYMAYGRDAQAEEILKDAIVKEPKRYELHLKLLEIYANRKDAIAFETLAGELYATLGTMDPVWSKVADMGRALEPENPMYAAVAGGDTATTTTPASSGSSAIIQASAGAAGAAAALGMTSGEGDEQQVQEEVEVQDNSLDFDLGMLGAEDVEVSTGIEKENDSAEAEPLPDLDAFETPAVEMKEEAVEAVADDASDMDLQFELPEPAAEANVQLDTTDLGLPEAEPPLENAEEEISFESPLPDIGVNEIESAQVLPDSETPVPDLASENELSLPELNATPTPDETVEEISFDLPELTLPGTESLSEEEVFSLPEAVEAPVMEEAVEPIELEKPVISEEMPIETIALAEPIEEPAAVDASEVGETAEPEPEMPAEPSAAEEVVEEIVFEEAPAEPESALDFNFDLDVAAESPVEEPATPAAPLPDLDLSGISLDIGEPAAGPVESADEEITLSGTESSDVDTKLDLVTAYMDMGDTEGARELLEEVLQEGGPQQRERAKKMLDSLA